jgi:hypothetical protein
MVKRRDVSCGFGGWKGEACEGDDCEGAMVELSGSL